jgi:hypothetical protein
MGWIFQSNGLTEVANPCHIHQESRRQSDHASGRDAAAFDSYERSLCVAVLVGCPLCSGGRASDHAKVRAVRQVRK